MNQFYKKTYGRIWVNNVEDMKKVDAIIKEVDEFEHRYLGKDVIALYEGNLKDVVYTHKFEIDILDLTQACWSRGIYIVCITGIRRDYID